MNAPSPEQLASLRSLHADLYRVTDGEFEIIVAPPTRPAYEGYTDGWLDPSTAADAEVALILDCAKWPTPAEVSVIIGRRPALAEKVCDVLDGLAVGGTEQLVTSREGAVSVELLDRARFDGEGNPVPHPLAVQLAAEGVNAEQLATLRSRSPRGGLRLVPTAAGVFVIATPGKSSYANHRKAQRMGAAGTSSAQYKLTLDCVKHPPTEQLRVAIERYPGLPGLLAPMLLDLAGRFVEVSATKI